MVKFSFKVDDPEDLEFYANVKMSFEGKDMDVTQMFEKFEQFMSGLGYHPESVKRYYVNQALANPNFMWVDKQKDIEAGAANI